MNIDKFSYQDDQGQWHSELSASGSERWLNCSASVELSHGIPNPPSSKYAALGTIAHDHHERWLHHYNVTGDHFTPSDFPDRDMYRAVKTSIDFILNVWDGHPDTLLVEEKISLSHIHPTMFGTADVQIIGDSDLLQVWDYKHGAGHAVDPITNHNGVEMLNTQLAFYALGAAHARGYKFKKVELGVIQPRAPHKTKAKIRSTTVSMRELMSYESIFQKGVDRVFSGKAKPFEGPWCHWCKAKSICPKKREKHEAKISEFFKPV